MTHRPTGPACGNNPNHPITDGDRQAVENFKAYLEQRGDGRGDIVRYRKRPVEVDTIRWTGDNEQAVQAFTGGPSTFYALDPADRENSDDPEATATVYDKLHSTWILVYPGQHIVRGVKGEYYPIAEDVLAETYEPVPTAPPVPAPATASPSNRRALVHNAITGALSAAGDRAPLSVRIAATRAALAEVDAWHAAEPAAASASVAPPTNHTAAEIREQLLHAIDPAYVSGVLSYTTPEDLLAAYDNSRTPPATEPTDRAALREQAEAILLVVETALGDTLTDDARAEALAGIITVLPEPAPTTEVPLSPYYEHPECGFHWHGRDGMDIPMRDGQPVCPRCELAKVQKRLDYTQRLRDEVGAESRRRGKIKLEQAEKIIRLERQIDEVQRQLGAEILRAGQAEAELRRLADEPDNTQTTAVQRHRPVSLATPCAACTHPYNWHCGQPQCQASRNGDLCGCRSFTPADEPAAGARQDGGQP